MTTRAFVGSATDMKTLRAKGADSFYCGSWGGFQRTLKPGDTAVITRAGRISKSAKRQEAVARELAEAGITLVILSTGEKP